MNTAEKVCASIGLALIITALFTALYYYIYKQQVNYHLTHQVACNDGSKATVDYAK